MKAMGDKRMLLNTGKHNTKVFFALMKFFSKLSTAYKSDLMLRWLGYPARLLITYLLWTYLLRINHASEEQTNAIIVYFVFALFLSHLFSFIRMARDIREEVYSGDIVTYMVRPLSHFFVNFAKSIVTIVLNTFIAIPLIVVIGFLITGYLPTLYQVLLFFVTFLMGFTITFMIYYIIGLTSFFTGEIMGTLRIFSIISEFLGGVFLPLYYFPLSLQSILYFSPFQFWVYLPASVISGNVSIASTLPLLLIGSIWIIILAIIIKIIWNIGTSRYSGHSI